MMSVNGRTSTNNSNNTNPSSTRYPFTASQWQELEHQALVYKYMVSGMPIPPDLLFTIRRSLDSSLSSTFLIQPQHLGWNSGYHMGFGRKIDPEPGRCRRTDGKKWRCSKEAYTDSKYCERHMHRGRNRSRKPVENNNNSNNNSVGSISAVPPTSRTISTATVPNAIPITPSMNSTGTKQHYPSAGINSHDQASQFLYPSNFGLSSDQDATTNFFLDSNNAYRRHEMKGESEEVTFFSTSEASSNSGTMRNDVSSWQVGAPPVALTMGSPLSQKQHKSNNYSCYSSDHHDSKKHQYYIETDTNNNVVSGDHEPKKVMHHFLDDWNDDKLTSQRTQLSISIPNSVHDFFMTQKRRLPEQLFLESMAAAEEYIN